MHRPSDVASKMVSAGLRHAATSNIASRPVAGGGGGGANDNTPVSFFYSARGPLFDIGVEGARKTRTIIFILFCEFVFFLDLMLFFFGYSLGYLFFLSP
jgi:hypothetical protein